MMRSHLAALLLLAGACAAAPAAAQLDGSYRLARIDGEPLPAPSPTEEGVVVHRASFLFQPDGRFAMQARSREEGEDAGYGEGSEGTYRIAADSIILTPDGGSADESIGFRWTLDGDTLHLFDAGGHDYAFAAAPPSAAALPRGSYRLVEINGRPVPAPAPAEEDVLIRELTVELRADGRYTMRLRALPAGEEAPVALEVDGIYRVEADELLLQPDDPDEGEATRYLWLLEGDVLRLVDDLDDEYTFARG